MLNRHATEEDEKNLMKYCEEMDQFRPLKEVPSNYLEIYNHYTKLSFEQDWELMLLRKECDNKIYALRNQFIEENLKKYSKVPTQNSSAVGS